MDERLKNLSHSAILTLHECPKKFQLSRLRGREREAYPVMDSTFTYGHCVGEGVQLLLQGADWQDIVLAMFRRWAADLFHDTTKGDKTFWSAIEAVRKMKAVLANGLLDDWELLYFTGKNGETKPACELGFRVTSPDGFRYRGFVDAVLRNKYNGKILVLELKTTSAKNVQAATYQNSFQAIGYSIVLDMLGIGVSSFEVLYLVYSTTQQEWIEFPFQKNLLQRAQWIQQLILDIDIIKMYENAGVYPMYGESCLNYNRECSFFGICTLSVERLATPPVYEPEPEFDVEVTLVDLINNQLNREV